MHLHSEVLRYSSSASTIRPLFEYRFMTITGYAFTILTIINLKRNVIVVTIYIYVGTSLHVRAVNYSGGCRGGGGGGGG